MSIFRRHKDLDELKKAVEKKEPELPSAGLVKQNAPLQIPRQAMEQPAYQVQQEIENEFLASVPPVPIMVHNILEKKEDHAPLFVKIEKYREIVASVQEVQTFISGIKQLFAILNEAEATRAEAMNMLRTTVLRLEKSIEWFDQSLLRPIGFEELPHGEMEVKHIERSLTDLQREISSLRRELDRVV